jgi:hypothetical protein
MLAHDDASTTVPETCRVLGISKSSYYAALREGRRQALEAAEAARVKRAMIANHASTRTTQLYDRRNDEVSLNEVERILIELPRLHPSPASPPDSLSEIRRGGPGPCCFLMPD